MKKSVLRVVAILLSISFFVACASTTEQVQEIVQEVVEETAQEEVSSDTRLTRDELLYDFDYMMQLMEDTFPLFGVAERRLGIDIRELARETREIIENYPYSMRDFAGELDIAFEDMPELDEQIFWSIVFFEFFMPITLGHTGLLNDAMYNRFRTYHVTPQTQFEEGVNQPFTNPNTRRFYEEQTAFARTLFAENPALFQFVSRIDPSTENMPGRVQLPRITTDIIEEGRVAYLNISSFYILNAGAYDRMLWEFYRNIQDYEHLIIDIRDNGGGRPEFWRLAIIDVLYPYGDTMFNMPLYFFNAGNELAYSLADGHLSSVARWVEYLPETESLITIDEILETSSLPYLNEVDLQNLSYGVRLNTSPQVRGGNIGLRDWPHIPFNGQIWLLINDGVGSGAAQFARYAKAMEFAILVGEPVIGSYSHWIPFALPNTGIIARWETIYVTDQYGRSIEEFPTAPHYFNLPGMDALETVLYMIGE